MNITNITTETFETVIAGGLLGGLIGTFLVIGILVSIGFYVYFALAWQTIAKKLKYKNHWLAWIPIANFAMILELGGFNWALIFLMLVPILGWITIFVLMVIATWRIFEKRNYPGWLSLSQIIPQVGMILYMVAIGFVAWKDQKKKKK